MQKQEHEFAYTIVAGTVSITRVDDFLDLLRDIAHKHDVTIQAMDAELIAGEEHVQSAVKKAVRAMESNKSITNDLGLEILLYAAGKRQIDRALAMGVSEGQMKVVLVIVAPRGGNVEGAAEKVKRIIGIKEEPVEELDLLNRDKREKLKHFFGITEEETSAVGEKKLKLLVLERVALLDVLK
jgi:KEOPS complex subunit Cgi121